MEVVASYDLVRTHEDATPGAEAGPIWELGICPACARPTLLEIDYCSYYEPSRWKAKVLYPQPEEGLGGLPSEIDKAYSAALKVRRIDSNAYAVLLGRVLDQVCIDRGASGASLYERLNSLAQKGEIPNQLAEMAHQLRQLRNIGAHADLGELTSSELPVLDGLCRAILEYVYTAPGFIEQVRQRLERLRA
jgi:hypothetical protein